ncbi:hypothetical protein HHX47_DHR1000530 [Lentinula edodes]|nr:hypothetical protein HHX47_DHR1000530 [Lentinula edodes]
MLQDFEEGGWLPMWKNMIETNITVGAHADSLLAEAVLKGFGAGSAEENGIQTTFTTGDVDYEAMVGLRTIFIRRVITPISTRSRDVDTLKINATMSTNAGTSKLARPTPFTPKRPVGAGTSMERLTRATVTPAPHLLASTHKKYKAPISNDVRNRTHLRTNSSKPTTLAPVPGSRPNSPTKSDSGRPRTPSTPRRGTTPDPSMARKSEMDVTNVDPEEVLVDYQNVEPADVSLGEMDEAWLKTMQADHGKEDKVMVSSETRLEICMEAFSVPNKVELQGGTVNGDIILAPLREEVVTSIKGVQDVLKRGESHRRTASGPLHWAVAPQPRVVDKLLVLAAIMVVHHCNRGMVGAYRPSLIDLAGFEKATSHKERTRGGKYINTSLLTLGTVISKLWDNATKQKNDHIPFHDSKLTRLLQPSLSGNARISVICTISPDPSPVAESTSTLLFAKRVKGVKLHAQKKEVIDTDALIERYRKEMDDLNLLLGALLVLVESALYVGPLTIQLTDL